MLARSVWFAAFVLFAACTGTKYEQLATSTHVPTPVDSVFVRNSLLALTDTLADAITRRDGVVAGRCAGPDSTVAYVTDGSVVRCRDLSTLLVRVYASLRSLDLHWEKREARVLDANAGVVTGWAAIAVVDSSGAASRNRAIFTLVYSRSAGQWRLVTAQKTTLPE